MSEQTNESHKSSLNHSLNLLKRIHPDSEAGEGQTSDSNSTKRLAVEGQDVMESNSGFGFGRGRGKWLSNRDKLGDNLGQTSATNSVKTLDQNMGQSSRHSSVNNSNETITPSPPKRATPSPPQSRNSSRLSNCNGRAAAPEVVDEEVKMKLQKEAEDRSGLSMDFMNALLAPSWLSPNPAADQQVLNQFAQNNARPMKDTWFHDVVPKKEEVKDESNATEKKFQGKQYVKEVQEKERMRSIQLQKEEKERQLAAGASGSSTQSPAPTGSQPLFRRHANRQPPNARNTSTLSLNSNHTSSTDLESIGTYQVLNIPETIEEDQDMPGLIEHYFSGPAPKRAKLPILDYEERIIRAINVNRVVILEGATGCGKTTQVPQYIADDCAKKGLPFNIVVTQPRRIAAKSIASRVADERGWQLGSIVGYQIGMDRTQVNADTRILYCTTGVLLQRLINSQKLDHFSHIVIDEVHERSIETDLLMLVIKKLMNCQSHSVKIVLMSATFDPQQLIEYFTLSVYRGEEEESEVMVTPVHIKVKEKVHDLNVFYLGNLKIKLGVQSVVADVRYSNNTSSITEKEVPCVSTEAVEVATAILEKGIPQIEDQTAQEKGAVLVFLPGLEEIHELKSKLENSVECKRQQWKIYPLHSSVPLDKQNAIFYKPMGRERKIILATNIAESSITVPDVAYVIDFCLTKSLVCDIETHIPVLRMEWASKANCQQRAGRAGRTRDGRVYRLVEKSFYDRLQAFSQPELVRSPLDLSILRVKMLNMGSPKDLLGLALDPPDLSDIYHSVLQLKQVGAFSVYTTEPGSREKRLFYDEEDGDITTLGIIMSHLPIDIRLAKLVVMGHVFDILEDCIIIAACLSTQGMFRRDFSQGLNAYKSRLAWADRSFSDSIAYLNAYKMYKKFNPEFSSDSKMADKWCRQNFLQYKRIKEVDYMVGELMERLRRENIVIPNRPNLRRNRNEEELILKIVMCAAFYPNYFTRNPIETELISKMLSNRDPHNSVMIHGLPANEGPLYTHAIRQMFSICAQRIDLNFEETKAYVTFLNDRHPLRDAVELHIPAELKAESTCGSMLGSQSSLSMSMQSIKSEGRETPQSFSGNSLNSTRYSVHMRKNLKETAIKTAVYVAVAMKYHREINKEVPKLDPKVAQQKLLSFDKFKAEKLDNWQSFRSNRVYVPHCLSRIKLKKLSLPALDCSQLEIRITHIEDPVNFYAQYAHQQTNKDLDEMSIIMSYSASYPFQPEMAKVGDYVIGPYRDLTGSQMSGRARIDNIEYKSICKEVDRVQIFFIDFGFTATIDDFTKLTQINHRVDQKLLDIPPLAFKCSLSSVNPSPIACFDSSWSKKAIDYFKAFVFPKSGEKEKIFTAKIYSVVNRVVRLELFRGVEMNESFNDKLVNIGYAYKSEETKQSVLNHDHRRQANLNSQHSDSALKLERSEQKGVYNPDEVIELEIDFNPLDRGHNIRSHDKFTIKGPESPLECKFTGLSRQQSNRSARIERDSVNSVVLESDYLSRHTRLLVASSVGLSQVTGNISLRNTTLMPNIRGFPAIMALMFAPRVQLRADKERQQYVGAICGIGYNKSSLKAYDPEYDIEIPFDADITREDMIRINKIRYHISDLLKSSDALRDYTEGSLVFKQRKVRRNVIELLDRRRRVVDTGSYFPSYKWNDSSVGFINSTLDRTDEELNAQLLPLCEQMTLCSYDWYEDIGHNLFELKDVQLGKASVPTKCKLCKFTSYTTQDIRSHLLSHEHTDAVVDFDKNLKIEESERRKQKLFEQQVEEGIDEEDDKVFDLDSDDE